MNIKDVKDIPAEKFTFVQENEKLHDQKFDTEPVGYFKDAWRRFLKNRSSVTGGIVIVILMLFSLLTPFFSNYTIKDRDAYYAYALPKCELVSSLGIWDGDKDIKVNQQSYDKYEGMPGAIVEVKDVQTRVSRRTNTKTSEYTIEIDSYASVGYVNLTVSDETYQEILQYEKDNNVQILYPIIDTSKVQLDAYKNDANAWYLTDSKGMAIRDEDGNLQDIYVKDSDGNALLERDKGNGSHFIRVLYSEYYTFKNGHKPSFLFGADANGYDIMTRLAFGARLSLVLSIVVSLINLLIGVVVGAIEGYYGGAVDLIIERIIDFLMEIPDIVIFSLFQMYLSSKVGPIPSLLFAFIFFGWIGNAGIVRAQMYRFKVQEYVLAARTLGAKDRRIIFRHILPNGIGYIITSCVLDIPSVILSEATLSFLGIVNLQSDNMTSIGTMLNNGQSTLSSYPHCVFFPAVFIALLLISFNLFGNGLRDAFNPALRGSDE